MNKKTKINPIVNQANLDPYTWADGCQGWHYLRSNNLSIIREEMIPNTTETSHFHNKSQQFFYILEGNADFILEDHIYQLGKGEGIHIPPLLVHKIKNNSNFKLEFLVISEPAAHGDRIQISHSNNNNN